MQVYYASEVAALLGLHPWQKRYEVVMKILARMGAIKAYEPSNQQAKRIFTQKLKVENLHTMKRKTLVETIDKAVETKQLSVEEAVTAKQELTHVQNQSAGQASEEKRIKQEKIVDNNSTLYDLPLSDLVKLVGRVDGYMEEGSKRRLVELKRRMKRFDASQPLPDYDCIQCFCYLKMAHADEILVMEEGPNELRRQTLLSMSDRRWKQLEHQLLEVAEDIRQLVSNKIILGKFEECGRMGDWLGCQMIWYAL